MRVRMGPVNLIISGSTRTFAVRGTKNISRETIRRVMRRAKPSARGMRRRTKNQRHRGNPNTQVLTRNSGR
jgi:hypothetical protein